MMNLSMIGSLILACSLSVPALAGDPASKEDLATAVYDLSGLVPAGAESVASLPLLPGIPRDEERSEHDGSVLAEALYSILVDKLFPDELQYEGREAELMDEDHLLLTAPKPIHERLQQMIEYVRRAVHRRAVLRVQSYAWRGELSALGSLDAAGLAAARDRGDVQLLDDRRVELVLGLPWHERLSRLTPMVQTWVSEVAESSAAFQPVISTLDTGWELDLLLAPGLDSRFELRLAAGYDELSWMESRSIAPALSVSLEGEVTDLTQGLHLDLPHVAVTRMAGASLLAPGEWRQWMALRQDKDGQLGLLLRVQLESVQPAASALSLGDMSLAVLDLAGQRWTPLHAPSFGSNWFSGFDAENGMSGYLEAPWGDARIGFPGEQFDWNERLQDALSRFEWDGGEHSDDGPWLLALGTKGEITRLATGMASRFPQSTPSATLEWGLRDGDGNPRALGRLPLLAGQDGMALVGRTFSTLQGLELYIATRAASQEPRVLDLFDGLWIRARPGTGDTCRVDLTRHALVDRELVPLSPRARGLFERTGFDTADMGADLPTDGKRHDLGRVAVVGESFVLWARRTLR